MKLETMVMATIDQPRNIRRDDDFDIQHSIKFSVPKAILYHTTILVPDGSPSGDCCVSKRTDGSIASMITIDDILKAHSAIQDLVHRTPVLSSESIGRMARCRLFLKAENLQRTGSFKVRGAFNKMSNLSPEARSKGVVAASAGNHAQGVALAASRLGVRATIVMPEMASLAKVEATKGYGAKVILHGDNFDQAVSKARELEYNEGLTLIPAFDDPHVIAGQGTLGLEVLEQVTEADVILVPVGGGGLISGVALAVKALRPSVRIIGVQASAATAALRSYTERRVMSVTPHNTLADGIAVGAPGQLTLPMMLKLVDDMVEVSEEEISQAMVLLLERTKLLVEGAGATPLAALLSGKVSCQGQTVVAVLSGGNIDVGLLDRVVEHGLTTAGRYLIIRVKMDDRPGRLAHLLDHIAAIKVNVLEVEHHRTGLPLPVGQVEVQLTLETKTSEHGEEICKRLRSAGYMETGTEAYGLERKPKEDLARASSITSKGLVRYFTNIE
ncbi:MAG: L-threonine ammonia-lyase [Dehalococcoidia bacterium]|nr:L-threonine ammonia-lyase [Dehalococcoidia bacterium]